MDPRPKSRHRSMRLSTGSSGLRRGIVAAVLIATTLCFQARGVLLARVFYFEDVAAYFEPIWSACARAMRDGRLPSWALGAWSGQPLLGDPQIGIFYPPHWLWLVA